MRALVRLSDILARIALYAGRIGAWACIPLIALIMVDVIARRFFNVGSTMLQELQWHFHALLFLSCIGFAYIRGSHVRIDMVREHLTERSRTILEAFGCAVILIPFCAVMIYYSVDIAWRAYLQGEGSPNPGGLPHWWIIKSAVPLGLLLAAVAGIAVLLRKIVLLYGPAELKLAVANAERAETTTAADDRRG